MNADALQATAPRSEVETHRPHELVLDEDVLSAGLRAGLEQVGSAVGVIAVLALVCAHFARARRLVARVGVRKGGAA